MYIDQIFCINLDSRKDRWGECKLEFPKLGLNESDITRFSAIEDKSGIVGCTKSHMEIIKICKDKRYTNVLILEDDIEVINPIKVKDIDLSILGEFAMYYLGSGIEHTPIKVNNDLLKLQGRVAGTHSYIINSACYDFILSHKWPWERDKVIFETTKDCRVKYIDTFYSNVIVPNFNCYHIVPMVTVQRKSYSDIMKRETDFSDFQTKSFNKAISE